MPMVQFPWDAQLVSVRREVCPHARWDTATRAWLMTQPDADEFLRAAHARMYVCKAKCTVSVDGAMWVIGFSKGTPYRQEAE